MRPPLRPAARLLTALSIVLALSSASLPADEAPNASVSATDFGGTASAALAAMKSQANVLGVKGVAIVAYAPGESVAAWSSQMLVVGNLTRAPTATDKGANFLAIAYAKAGEMAATQKDSGNGGRPVYAGEVGWQGGAMAKGKSGFLFAAFSGGKGEEDYQISKAGLAVLAHSL
jgi:hypothetical protein